MGGGRVVLVGYRGVGGVWKEMGVDVQVIIRRVNIRIKLMYVISANWDIFMLVCLLLFSSFNR